MPLIGLISVIFLNSVLVIPAESAPALFFAMLVVTCTPTGNNIQAMAEIGGVNKDIMALCILTQYMFTPVVLTAWVTVFQTVVNEL